MKSNDTRLNVAYSNLPPNFIELPNWVARGEGKVPIDESGKPADHVKVRTNLNKAIIIAAKHGGGIGYSIDNEGDRTAFVIIDLDGAIDEHGELKDWAVPIVEHFRGITYSQKSMSGRGLHFICEGDFNCKIKKVKYGTDHEALEIFDTKRFLVMTGDNDVPLPVSNAQEALDWLVGYLLNQQKSREVSTTTVTNNSAAYQSGFRVSDDWQMIRERALKYARTIPPAISGQGGHDQTFETCLKICSGFDLTDEEAFEVLREWNLACQPPWSEPELKRKITEAQKIPSARGAFISKFVEVY